MEIPIIAETIFHISSFPVTNTLINTTIVMVLFVIFALVLRSRIAIVPGKLQNAFEALLETLFGYFDQVTGNRKKSVSFLPLVGSLFLFILVSNWFGLLPGTGSIGVWHTIHGERELVPLLRSAGSDLNLTLAMALISVITSHVIGMMSLGFFTHWNKFIQLGNIWKAIMSLNVGKILLSLLEFIVGLIELMSEAAKILSLSLRLFGNVFAGEVLLGVIASLVAYVVPLPFLFLEILVGVVQASVFAMLTLVYLTTMSSPAHGSHKKEEAHETLSAPSLTYNHS